MDKSFSAWYKETLATHFKDDADLSGTGVHSLKKSCGTYITGGTTAAPNPATVELRLGHSLGRVQNAYIFQAAAGDQYSGRLISMLNIHDANEFLALPPHFKNVISYNNII
jgi:hypothetical protein